MQKIVSLRCPKCNSSQSFYRFGKDRKGFQKYQCRSCYHQFAPDRPSVIRKHPACPVCGRASYCGEAFIFPCAEFSAHS